MTSPVLAELAAAVRSAPRVSIVGSGSSMQFETPQDAIELRAPRGIVSHVPEELTITVKAGTPVAEIIDVLSEARQRLRLAPCGTVGGAVATRRNGLHPISNSTLPNTVLMTRSVSGRGEIFVTGGPTVKNVSGFDLNKMLTGSWGIFALLVEVTLRVEPVPSCTRWFLGEGPEAVASLTRLFRPAVSHVEKDTVLVCLEGHAEDVAEQAALLRDCVESETPDLAAHLAAEGSRSSVPSLQGVGPEADVVRRLKALFDPDGKMNSRLTSTDPGVVGS